MKHLLNDIPEWERNSIREQHKGGISIDTSRFKKLMESKLGDSKPLINEEKDSNHDIKMEFMKKMNDYKEDLQKSRFLDQYDTDKGEVKKGEFRSHPEGQKQTYRFLNSIILRLSKMLKDFKKESDSSDDYDYLEKRAFDLYNDMAKKVDEEDSLPKEESFSKFKKHIEREYRYDL